MINFTKGEFKLTDGTIQLPTSPLPNSGSQWVDAIYASGSATVTVAGGTVVSTRATDTGINVENGTLIIDSGVINIPKGNAVFARDLQINDVSVITGVASEISTGNDVTAHVYGNTTSVTDSEVFFDKYDADDFSPDSISYIAEDGAVWNVEGVQSDMRDIPSINMVSMTVKGGATLNLKNTNLTFKGTFNVEQNGILNVGTALGDTSRLTYFEGTATNYGTINIYGTLTNLDKVVNNRTINNYSGNTLDNQKELINNDTINNYANGKIRNTGTIGNANGKIDNTAGGTFESVQTVLEMGNGIDGPVELINNEPSSGGGCNSGFGLFGLLLLVAFAVHRKYLTA
jgi:Synergist-CTERM protein sorting domain-containing protein